MSNFYNDWDVIIQKLTLKLNTILKNPTIYISPTININTNGSNGQKQQQQPHNNNSPYEAPLSKYETATDPLSDLKTYTVTFTETDELGLSVGLYCEETGQDAVVVKCLTPFAKNNVITPSIIIAINKEIVYKRQFLEIRDILIKNRQCGPVTIIFSPLFVQNDHDPDVQEEKSSIMIEENEKEKEKDNVNSNVIIYDDINDEHLNKINIGDEDIKKKNNQEKPPVLPGSAPLIRTFDYNRNFGTIQHRLGFKKVFLTMILSQTLSTGARRYVSQKQLETYSPPWTVYTNAKENVVFDVGMSWAGRAITISPDVMRKSAISYTEAVKKVCNALQTGRLTKYGKNKNKRYVYAFDGELLKLGANGLTLLSISPQPRQ